MDPAKHQLTVKLITWRQKLGQLYDEDQHSILPNHHLFRLAEAKPLSQRDLYFSIGGEKNAHFAMIKHKQDLIELIKSHIS
jgi:ribonuclease D